MITITSLGPSKGLSRNMTATLQDSSRAWMYAHYIFPQGLRCSQLRSSVADLFLGKSFIFVAKRLPKSTPNRPLKEYRACPNL